MEGSQNKLQKINSGKWKKTEHDRFMRAIQKYGRNWNEVQRVVKTRSIPQVRSHAQKIYNHLSKEEKRYLEMDDFERQVDFCKPKKYHQCDDHVSKSTDKSETQKDKFNEDQSKQPPNQLQCPLLPQQQFEPIIPQFTWNQEAKFPESNDKGYLYSILTSKMMGIETGYPWMGNFPLMPLTWMINPMIANQVPFQQYQEGMTIQNQ